MSNDNSVTIIGRLARDPELRFTQGGHAVCSFGLAWAPRRKNDKGEWEDGETSFFQCTAWRDLGEHISASLVKGDRVVVVGTISIRPWEDKNGGKRTSTEIEVADIGPSLRWNDATVERTQRSTPSGGPRKPEPVYGDEEPF